MIKGFKSGINKTMFITLCSLVASAKLASAAQNGVFLGIGASFGFEAMGKADLLGDQNASSIVKNTTKGLGGGGELVVGYKYFLWKS